MEICCVPSDVYKRQFKGLRSGTKKGNTGFVNDVLEASTNGGLLGVLKNSGADFSLVSDTPLSLSCLLQSVAIDVNEEGTTAAAFTEATVYRSIVEDVVTVTFDHPFTYYIYEETSGQVLFAGKMNQAE